MPTGVFLDDILTACTAIVQGLTLTGLPTANVSSRFVATLHEGFLADALPAVLICPDDTGEEPSGETFEAELDWKYRVYVVIVPRNNQDMQSNRNQYLGWRQQIRGSALAGSGGLTTPMLPGAPNVWDARMKPKSAFDRRLLRQFAPMATVFEYMSHESRFT